MRSFFSNEDTRTQRRSPNLRVFAASREIIVFFSLLLVGRSVSSTDVTYNRDVLPILSNKCFKCHGADSAQRKAGLRLDVRESATANRDGSVVISPGKPNYSELVRRIRSTDPDLAMPPIGEDPLTLTENQILQNWIEQGAVYEKHWAFLVPRKATVPESNWGINKIDRFVHRRLHKAGLEPQPAAPREQWIRRVTFDLTGLPPTLEEVDAFLADRSDKTFERVVDRLLKSPRYGERMALWWLDGAHYGDSHGYDNDLENSQWPWRNWLIEAFNSNKPFDDFTIEQLAGDLLPNATESQILATAFNRNHRIQTEDGAIDEEWRTEYVIDRVETTGAVWMGLTLGCCRCHDHKYDPISQREFYQLFSLFNNLNEKGFINNLRGAAEPRIRHQATKYEREFAAFKKSERTVAETEVAKKKLEARHPFVMVMHDEKPRQAFVLLRGQYDSHGEPVSPGLPSALPAGDTEKVTRLSFARWLVNGRHPLTARVTVNRLWEQLFGTGLVKSSENFGVQADWPSHPELLDWLAVDFVESDWNVKELLRKIVLSATYRQDHIVGERRLRLDPENRLLSRGPRFRLPAEMIRNQALAVSGLFHEQLGGPSVKPYQPVGLWEEVEKRGTFQQDHGTRLYRRSLYTTIRKTVAPPDMVLFDMPSREVCTVKRARTNTPLQALSLLNNVTYVEASRKFAERILKSGSNINEQIAWAFRRVTQRHPTEKETTILVRGYERRLKAFRTSIDHASELLTQGEAPTSGDFDKAKLAAMTTVASVLLNLDEVINK